MRKEGFRHLIFTLYIPLKGFYRVTSSKDIALPELAGCFRSRGTGALGFRHSVLGVEAGRAMSLLALIY